MIDIDRDRDRDRDEDINAEEEPRFVISIAARIIGVHTQTLRYYERAGLIVPRRSSGRIRLYSQRDIDRLKHIKALIDDLGVNLAGVEVVLRMAERMMTMHRSLMNMEQELKRLKEGEIDETR